MDVPFLYQFVMFLIGLPSASDASHVRVRLSEVRLKPDVLVRTTLLTTGGVFGTVTLMNTTCVEMLYPALLLAFNTMEKFPAPNVCVAFRTVLHHTCVLFPVTFLNDQFQAVGEFVEVSLNWTVSGAVPEVTLAVKFAIGGFWDIVRVLLRRVPPSTIPSFGVTAPCQVSPALNSWLTIRFVLFR
jgi:hypothetical protein